MTLITWDDSKFSVNINVIDVQHKKLVELINLLHGNMKVGRGKDVIGKVLNELISYTDYHFDTEERLFQQHGYPDIANHKKVHGDLKKKAIELKTEFEKGVTIITPNVLNFLSDWLTNHIIKMDKAYSAFLNGKGVV